MTQGLGILSFRHSVRSEFLQGSEVLVSEV